MKIIVMTVSLVAVSDCSGGTSLFSYNEPMETLEICLDHAENLLQYQFVKNVSCNQINKQEP